MGETNPENTPSQSLTISEMVNAIRADELDDIELDDAIEACFQMAKMKENKGETEKAENWKQVVAEAQRKVQERNSEMEKLCPNCGVPNRNIANFCRRCGTDVKAVVVPNFDQQENGQKKVCPKCGHEGRPSAKFCAMCGTSVIESE